MPGGPYSTIEELQADASLLVGKTLREVATFIPEQLARASAKGTVGHLVQTYFGLKPRDSDPRPDFHDLGIELKTIPVKDYIATGIEVKEKCPICTFRFVSIEHETFAGSHLEVKTRRILFVFYRWEPEPVLIEDLVILGAKIWKRDPRTEAALRSAHDYARSMVARGLAHHITESATPTIGVATKGQGGGVAPQPHSDTPARTRCFAFKRAFVNDLWLETRDETRSQITMPSVPDTVEAIEQQVLARLRPYLGSSVAEILDATDIRPAVSKDRVSILARKLLGSSNGRSPIAEIEGLGAITRTVRVGENGYPHESVSFPAMDFQAIATETWDEAELREYLQRILFVVFQGPPRLENWYDLRLRRTFYWTPTEAELQIIKGEWQTCIDLIGEGRMDLLPKESQTTAIHVRPHTATGSHRKATTTGKEHVISSFWLNARFVGEIIGST